MKENVARSESTANETWDETWDFVIVGSGAGGAIESLFLKVQGFKPLMLESTNKYGGTTAISGGAVWIPNNPVMKRRGIVDSYETARVYLDACAGPPQKGSTPERREAFLRTGPEMVTFLERQGMQFVHPFGWADYHVDDVPGGSAESRTLTAKVFDLRRLGKFADLLRDAPGRPPVQGREMATAGLYGRTWASKLALVKIAWRVMQNKLFGRRVVGTGPALQGRIYEMLLRNNVDMRAEADVHTLVAKDGRVQGVVATIAGRHVRLRATQGVLISAGGFSQNEALRKEFQPQVGTSAWTTVIPSDQGRMLEQAIAIGADTHLLDQSWWVPLSFDSAGTRYVNNGDLAKPHCIL